MVLYHKKLGMLKWHKEWNCFTYLSEDDYEDGRRRWYGIPWEDFFLLFGKRELPNALRVVASNMEVTIK